MVQLDLRMLSIQPASASRCVPDTFVVSAIVDGVGESRVISRYGDDIWNLWPFFSQSNLQDGRKTIDWRSFPRGFRSDCKAVFYRYWKVGVPPFEPPLAVTLRRQALILLPFLRYLEELGLENLGQVRPIHCTNFVHAERTAGRSGAGISMLCNAISLLHVFRAECESPFGFEPWPDGVTAGLVGNEEQDPKSGKTKPIPQGDLAIIFRFAEDILAQAEQLLDECDAGTRSFWSDTKVRLIRDAGFFLLGILTGMRCEELAGVVVGAGRTEVLNGVTFYWVRSTEHKTKKGQVEYLMPAMGLRVLELLERWSAPLRGMVTEELVVLQEVSAQGGLSVKGLQRMSVLQQCRNALFLTMPRSRSGIAQMSGIGWHAAMKEFAERAGSSWALAPHQLRRTYAWTFVRHRLGNLLLLKEQFKHSSLSMTELYAANPMQDAALYEELLTEVRAFKVELLTQWTSDDSPLSGGAGRKITQLRANFFDNRVDLILDTALAVNIRATGHAWCLAQSEGCGGAGLYERTRCGNCSNACIDRSQTDVWREIYAQQKELLEDAQDLGPGAVQRIKRDCDIAFGVLADLGLTGTP